MKNEVRRKTKTLGSLFAGIGGFDLGFERAGWKTKWQVEINPINRAVLADRFPRAERFEDVRSCGHRNLGRVDCIVAGFPCQDISNGGNSRKDKSRTGLRGARSGLFFEALRIIEELQPSWVVLENVAQLLASNDSKDIERIIQELAHRNYLGCARVLDAAYFGVPQKRRRVFLVADLGRFPPLELLADSSAMDAIPCTLEPLELARSEAAHAANTLSAKDVRCRINLGYEVFIAEEDGWREMAKRQRRSALHGIPLGLDDENVAQAFAAGNAVPPPVAQWVAEKLK